MMSMSAIQFDETETRRLPVYLLLDCSGSMAGPPIVAVNNGVGLLYRELLNNPNASETVWISVITFAKDATRLPLTELAKFTPPTLTANGPTAMGAALRELNTALDTEVIASEPGKRRGDYKPLAFLLTDGVPTDEWKSAADAIKARTRGRLGTFVALGCGDEVKVDVLHAIADRVLLMRDLQGEHLQEFFRWVSASIKQASVAAARMGSGTSLTPMPPPPPTLQDV